ncbi:hypothetical protein NX722_23445 [Endozoicomonas gorgoniicola]|uniref:DNA pilot protein n=1 Tax=Endozoicomonas gorgoniicola TaxID=1234144 RepID=A0ABT3N1K9_9GAMM|nr:hypothetical protein [Endozoicomonas gorgoniicola]MCW7555522.1 hypothetical protein [Endozoicomonas gorgoniicola]
MGISLGGGKSKSKSQSSSESSPLSPDEVQKYFEMINKNSGGRLNDWATNGTAAVNYNPLTKEELSAIGGAGETRRQATKELLNNQMDTIKNDSSLTVAQRMRGQQVANESASKSLDGINKEVEASMSALVSQDRMRQYQAALQNSLIPREDLAAIASIFFGGKGQKSSSQSSGSGSSWNFSGGVKI